MYVQQFQFRSVVSLNIKVNLPIIILKCKNVIIFIFIFFFWYDVQLSLTIGKLIVILKTNEVRGEPLNVSFLRYTLVTQLLR